jgi:antitoxin component of MazEF toxin-antitoxin module
MRNRKIKKIGNSYFVILSKYDMQDYGLVEGDTIDLDPTFEFMLKQHSPHKSPIKKRGAGKPAFSKK